MNLHELEKTLISVYGVRLAPEQQPDGSYMVGVGHRVSDSEHITSTSVLSLESCGFYLTRDIAKCIGVANTIFGRDRFESFSDCRQNAIIELVFAFGRDAFKSQCDFIECTNLHQWHLAASSAFVWMTTDGGMEVSRALRIESMFKNGSIPKEQAA